MNRTQFLDALAAALATLPDAERARLIAYYAEIIDDRVEEGMSEAEAVAALGDPAALARELHPDAVATVRQADPSAEYVDALREIRIDLKNADAQIIRGTLSDGAAARIQASAPNLFTWQVVDGVLEIDEVKAPERYHFNIRLPDFSRSSRKLTLTLADVPLEGLTVDTVGGDQEIADIAVAGPVTLSSASGDIELKRCACGALCVETQSGDAELRDVRAEGDGQIASVSGDVELERVEVRGDLEAQSRSGDIALREIAAAGALRVYTTSGDAEVSRARAESFIADMTSGDLRMEALEAAADLEAETRSGDIDLTRGFAPRMCLASAGGDVTAKLENRPVRISADSRSGDIRLPKAWTPPAGDDAEPAQLSVHTTSGDIHVSVL